MLFTVLGYRARSLTAVHVVVCFVVVAVYPGEISGGMEGHACKNCDWERPAPERKDRVSTAEAAAVHRKDESSCDGTAVYSVANCKRGECVFAFDVTPANTRIA
jgi:hypothetical protein